MCTILSIVYNISRRKRKSNYKVISRALISFRYKYLGKRYLSRNPVTVRFHEW